MKVLWICNVPLPEAKDILGEDTFVHVSWLVGISEALRKKADLYIAYTSAKRTEIASGKGNAVTFLAVPRAYADPGRFDPALEGQLIEVYKKVQPDVIHVFGTEFPHTLSVVHASEKSGYLDRTVISIQGLVSIIAKHYCASVPEWVQHFYTVRDMLRRSNIRGVQADFTKRGSYEIAALQKARHVIGRTDFDEACTKMYNPGVNYHFNNEILRDSFYRNEWKYENCIPHRMFMSQGGFPYKGFHFMVEALAILRQTYPDVELYIPERDFVHPDGWKEKIRLNSYQYYIRKLIRKYHLEEQIHFLGTLSEEQMCEQYLKANVFILPSAIENSSNSLGEAMLLGTPAVAADVGGIKNMLLHNEEGYVYQHDAPYMIAYYADKYFRMKERAKALSDRARAHAAVLFDRETNIEALVSIYEAMHADSK